MSLDTHEHWMQQALDLARLAWPSGDVPVGALVVYSEQVIAKAFEQVSLGEQRPGCTREA